MNKQETKLQTALVGKAVDVYRPEAPELEVVSGSFEPTVPEGGRAKGTRH